MSALKVLPRPIVPASRPQLSAAEALTLLRANGLGSGLSGPAVLLIRGYYLDGQGDVGDNDRNTYDDAAFVVEVLPNGRVGRFAAYNANVDPYKEGINPDGRGWPTLQPGAHLYRFGLHNSRYLALKPYVAVPVVRDPKVRGGTPGPVEFNSTINGHAGGVSWTWSYGCWTIINSQYGVQSKSLDRTGTGFIDLLWRIAETHGRGCSEGPATGTEGKAVWAAYPKRKDELPIPVILVDERSRRARK